MQSPYLLDEYRPVSEETPAVALETIEGAVPRALHGSFVRNGPNPRFEPLARHHWFDGDGMLHAVRFEDGVARYSSRYVRTDDFGAETAAGQGLFRGLLESVFDNPEQRGKDTGNTDVLSVGGELLTTHYQCGAGWRVDPVTLETRGRLAHPTRLSAHAKVDPRTGELLFFDYQKRPPYLTVGWVGDDGSKVVELPVDEPVFPHDMTFTPGHAIVMAPPVVQSEAHARAGRWGALMDKTRPFRFFLVPRAGGATRTFEASPCYLYHVINAWESEDGHLVHLIGFRCPELFAGIDPDDGPYAVMMANLRLRAQLHRWTFDLRTGQTSETQLDDRCAEFPTTDDRRLGVQTKFGYAMRIPDTRRVKFDAVLKYDLNDGSLLGAHAFGEGRSGSEAPFAPTGPGEDEGYLVSFVSDPREGRDEVVVLDAPTMRPVARLALPHRVPVGFHACWCPAA